LSRAAAKAIFATELAAKLLSAGIAFRSCGRGPRASLGSHQSGGLPWRRPPALEEPSLKITIENATATGGKLDRRRPFADRDQPF
jgi:hypothetical protein